MSTFARLIFSLVFVVSLCAGTLPAEAQAVPVLAPNAWSPFTTIQYVRQNQTSGNDETYFTLAGTTCGTNLEFYFEASAAAHESMVKVALAAFMAGRQVRVKHDGCRVYNLWMR